MIIESIFKPAWYLRNRHLQTIWPKYRKRPDIELQLERLETNDDDFLDLVWTKQTDGPIVVILHGLEGNLESHYVKNLLEKFYAMGWNAVLMHFRGCSGEPNRQARGYHSGETSDMGFLFKTISERYPGKPISAAGFSLGGNALLKYLGEQQENSLLKAACAISVPFELAKSAVTLKQGFSRIYQKYLIDSLQKKVRKKFKTLTCPIDISELETWNDFYTLDNNLTAPLHGFDGADDYYSRCSSRQFLKTIVTPTLIIQAKDDPFLPKSAIPEENELSNSVTLELSEHGGHVGFVQNDGLLKLDYWLDTRIPEFLQKNSRQAHNSDFRNCTSPRSANDKICPFIGLCHIIYECNYPMIITLLDSSLRIKPNG